MGVPAKDGEGLVTRRDAAVLGGLSHSPEHMKRMNQLSPKSGRTRHRDIDEINADPRNAKTVREIQRRYADQNNGR
jgi:hypothetical protein